MVEEWTIQLGNVVTRDQVKAVAGGGTQGGIQPSATTPNVLIYSDPVEGRQHGYNFDGEADDGAFFYTGEGQVGDQVLTHGNAAILDHRATGRTLRVFEVAGKVPGSATKLHRYLGEYGIDPRSPYRREEAPDRNGEDRTVLVFRLLPAGDHIDSSDAADEPAEAPGAMFIPAESNTNRSFPRRGAPGGTAERREADLSDLLQAHLEAGGGEVGRQSLHVPGSARPLLTDLYDRRTGLLYEVKGAATREAVRMAVGQLMDYRRHIDGITGCLVVLPVRPAEDLVDLVLSAGFGPAYPTGVRFETVTGAPASGGGAR